MLCISFVIMYLVMFLNLDKPDHFYLNINRLYMAVLMVAPMAVVMLAFMRSMYRSRKHNLAIVAASIVLTAGSFFMLRSQAFIDEEQFMRSMIPHHSSAILVSQEATITDPEVKRLSRQIIESQKKEIDEMKKILERMERGE